MDCGCDYDPPSVYSHRVVTARKSYRCEECAAKINPGDRYETTFGVWDGYPETFRTCLDCVDVRTWVRNNVPCFCWAHGNMREDAQNAIEDAVCRAPDETRGLRFGFGRLLVKQRQMRA